MLTQKDETTVHLPEHLTCLSHQHVSFRHSGNLEISQRFINWSSFHATSERRNQYTSEQMSNCLTYQHVSCLPFAAFSYIPQIIFTIAVLYLLFFLSLLLFILVSVVWLCSLSLFLFPFFSLLSSSPFSFLCFFYLFLAYGLVRRAQENLIFLFLLLFSLFHVLLSPLWFVSDPSILLCSLSSILPVLPVSPVRPLSFPSLLRFLFPLSRQACLLFLLVLSSPL